MQYNFNDAEPNTFDLIPAKTVVPVRLAVLAGDAGTPENAFSVTKTGLLMLTLEATITEGQFAKRRLWHRMLLGAKNGVEVTEGQQKAINMSRATIRAILEAARGIAPTDESDTARAARKFDSVFEMDGMEVWIEVGVEEGTGGYEDKNIIRRVLPYKADRQGPVQGALPMGNAAPQGARPAPAANAPTAAKKPAWA